ncbi:hypothetical protein D7U98_11785 [Stenotrophomonas maltophilia]|uniref:Lipoprotein n=1 Tax=Stenotrophomonas maltophilia (strain R551-3) TaxID=391008 RepID=B4SKT7_STRM5|nr:hypothetical protein [Stenotrophomonas maltophilia]ACF50435.1 hypothetical protein Smal_0730 [Stenotrophomonas maltophilia R551-3]MBA0396073.1 hypothetical protein [Stenotrophomonas maltophilia]PJL43685.1 hypothetical protein B9Y56_02925 [Stenotrophomonas maltophilia]QGL74803.1 hypothetical protein FEO95_03770 [Stenotrophomonas maltophilia]
MKLITAVLLLATCLSVVGCSLLSGRSIAHPSARYAERVQITVNADAVASAQPTVPPATRR